MLIDTQIDTQHPLNKLLTKRATNNRLGLYAQLLFWLIEILLRGSIVHYQHVYIHIQHFNRK